MNPYFRRQPNLNFFDEDAFSAARTGFFENRECFFTRLTCAEYFDAERFDAMLLWLETLKQFYDANEKSMSPIYFEDADDISHCLEVQATYSKTQREICAEALIRWNETLLRLAMSK